MHNQKYNGTKRIGALAFLSLFFVACGAPLARPEQTPSEVGTVVERGSLSGRNNGVPAESVPAEVTPKPMDMATPASGNSGASPVPVFTPNAPGAVQTPVSSVGNVVVNPVPVSTPAFTISSGTPGASREQVEAQYAACLRNVPAGSCMSTVMCMRTRAMQLGQTPPELTTCGLASPLVVNFASAPLQFSAQKDGTWFDILADGKARRISKIEGGEGFLLARDSNRDGLITSGEELFGNASLLASGRKAENGFEALRRWDVNRDGVVDRLDPAYASLVLWNDANGDGKSSASELSSPAQRGILAFHLGYATGKSEDAHGNVFGQIGFVELAGGGAAPMIDVWFSYERPRLSARR